MTRLWIPVGTVAIIAFAWLPLSRPWQRRIAEAGMILGTLPWVWLILTPKRLPPNAITVYLVPLSDLWHQRDVVQIVGNLLVLFAFGAFAPIRFPSLTLPRLTLLGGAISLTLELLQHFFVPGRVFSVDDVWLNALGCVLGGLVTRRRWRATTSA